MLHTQSQIALKTSRLLLQEQKEGRICLYHSENCSEAEKENCLMLMIRSLGLS